jgi:hypothetical protein
MRLECSRGLVEAQSHADLQDLQILAHLVENHRRPGMFLFDGTSLFQVVKHKRFGAAGDQSHYTALEAGDLHGTPVGQGQRQIELDTRHSRMDRHFSIAAFGAGVDGSPLIVNDFQSRRGLRQHDRGQAGFPADAGRDAQSLHIGISQVANGGDAYGLHAKGARVMGAAFRSRLFFRGPSDEHQRIGSAAERVGAQLFLIEDPVQRFPERSLLEVDSDLRISARWHAGDLISRLLAKRLQRLGQCHFTRECHQAGVHRHFRGRRFQRRFDAQQSLPHLGRHAIVGFRQQRQHVRTQLDQLFLGRFAQGQFATVELLNQLPYLLLRHRRFFFRDGSGLSDQATGKKQGGEHDDFLQHKDAAAAGPPLAMSALYRGRTGKHNVGFSEGRRGGNGFI